MPRFDDLAGQVGACRCRSAARASRTAAGCDGLDRLDALRPVLHALGARHAAYGVREPHFDSVGQALLEILAEEFGEAFTADVRAAWCHAYGALAEPMKAGLAEAARGVAAVEPAA